MVSLVEKMVELRSQLLTCDACRFGYLLHDAIKILAKAEPGKGIHRGPHALLQHSMCFSQIFRANGTTPVRINIHARPIPPKSACCHVGIPKVQFQQQTARDTLKLATFTSTSRNPDVAMKFRGKDGGMLIKLQTQRWTEEEGLTPVHYFCDVSWM